MKRGLTPTRALALACAAVLLLGLLPQQPAPVSSPVATQPYVYTGTVHAVQPNAGSLDLITGVGYALRLVHISVLPETQTVSGGGSAIRLADIKPGDVLRADCRMTTTGLVADRIEKLPAPSDSGHGP
jgi:hypothetical protein